MLTDALYDEEHTVVPARAIVTLLAGMAAAWLAADSAGLMAHSFRHAATWLAMITAVVAAWPTGRPPIGRWIVLAVAVPAAAIMTASNVPVVNILAVAVVLAALAHLQTGLNGRVALITATAVTVLGIFRLAYGSIPVVWLAANAIGRAMGYAAGMITGEPLWIGATMAGIDFLVLTAALAAGWLICTAAPRRGRAIYAAVAILLGQMLYLIVLAFSCKLAAALPEVVLPLQSDKEQLGAWALSNAVRTLLPWNLPVLAGIVQATIVAVMFRWADWLPVVEPEPEEETKEEDEEEITGREFTIDAMLHFAPVLLAVAVPLAVVLAPSRSDLSGKTIVAYEQGYLDWLKPEHDGESSGTYGMLPALVKSLGGRFVASDELSEQDLAQADVLLLLHPNRPWPADRLERVWRFVRNGGSLLLAAGPRAVEVDGNFSSSFNEVLRPTAMQVRNDVAVSKTNNWEGACELLSHPATAGLGSLRNRFALISGSSIRTHLPAAPLLVGRWAFSDPGSDATAGWVAEYTPGEKLGDLVLAAEQRFGRGRIVVTGDASCLHNDMIAGSYMFTGRLLGYLANKSCSPQTWWRGLLGLLAIVALVAILSWRAQPMRTIAAAVVLAVSFVCCQATGRHASRVLPDGATAVSAVPLRKHGQYARGTRKTKYNLAYIDASHIEAFGSEAWRDDGIAGLARTLMRNGYLPLLLPELTTERLERAGSLISIAPARPFSPDERAVVRKFVEDGGAFIVMVGSEESASSRRLLAEFGFYIPPMNVPPTDETKEAEPLGLGAFRQTYVDTDDSRGYMQTYAAWEIECGEPNAEQLMLWADDKTQRPFVISRRIGGGSVTVIGDTCFAMNKNLESADYKMQENVNFWRWLLGKVTDRPAWAPPKLQP